MRLKGAKVLLKLLGEEIKLFFFIMAPVLFLVGSKS